MKGIGVKGKVDGERYLGSAQNFETSPEFWLGLQAQYDLGVEEDEFGDRLERDVKVYAERNRSVSRIGH